MRKVDWPLAVVAVGASIGIALFLSPPDDQPAPAATPPPGCNLILEPETHWVCEVAPLTDPEVPAYVVIEDPNFGGWVYYPCTCPCAPYP